MPKKKTKTKVTALNKPWYKIKAAGESRAEILIYGDIGEKWWDDESITAKQLVQDLSDLDVDELDVRINSYGGVVADGIAIFNALRRHSATINTFNDGVAYSIASLILMAGDSISMATNALLMLHAPWGVSVGNAQEMRRQADTLDKYADAMTSAYLRDDGPEENQIQDWLKDGEDHYFTASEAVDYGLVDDTEESIDIAASLRTFDLTRFFNPAAPAAATTLREEKKMPEALKKTKAADKSTADEKTNVTEIEAKAREKQAAEIQVRNDELEAIAGPFMGDKEIRSLYMAALKDPSVTVDKFRADALAKIGERSGDGATTEPAAAVVTEDSHDKFRAGATEVLHARAGLHEKGKRPDIAKNEFSSFSLMDMARQALALAGVRTDGMDRMELVGAAFAHSTSDFPYILENTGRKALLMGYSEAPETFGLWTRAGNLSDFKTASRTGLSEFSDLEKVGEDGEFKHGSFGDQREQITLETYGKLFRITRQAIINDDMNAFSAIPRKMGRAAARKIGDLAWGVLTGNAAMADGTALFHADHSNLGTAGAPTVTTVGAGKTSMGVQTDSSGNATLNITPSYLLVPRALEDTANVLMSAENDPSITTRNGKPNPQRNLAEVVSDARLDAASTTAWYLAADPSMFDTVEVAYLDGNPNPFLEQQEGWSVDGTEFKVRIDAAAKALDHRSMHKNAGA